MCLLAEQTFDFNKLMTGISYKFNFLESIASCRYPGFKVIQMMCLNVFQESKYMVQLDSTIVFNIYKNSTQQLSSSKDSSKAVVEQQHAGQ